MSKTVSKHYLEFEVNPDVIRYGIEIQHSKTEYASGSTEHVFVVSLTADVNVKRNFIEKLFVKKIETINPTENDFTITFKESKDVNDDFSVEEKLKLIEEYPLEKNVIDLGSCTANTAYNTLVRILEKFNVEIV